ncbi:MAG: sterol desaturase family protein [Labrys sp. (in: a-proteobacteria)]|jgi:sterol desaturase/sphingolipid hydroxylase (fatty acid hydroxylase superfamily)
MTVSMLFDPTMARTAVFLGVFAVMALWEVALPARALRERKPLRWLTNLGILVIDVAILRLVLPGAAIAAALYAEQHDIGLLAYVGLTGLAAGLVGFLILDLALFWQHVLSHRIPILWRVHAMHHADRDLDVTSGLRFHPIEVVLSMLFKMAVIVTIGVPAWAVFVFEIVLNAAAQFNHSNVAIPARIEPWLRLLIVTPDMHRTHHSIDQRETDTNFGFFLSVWDRLFGVYTAEPAAGRAGLVLGLSEHQHHGPSQILWSLLMPFRKAAGRD